MNIIFCRYRNVCEPDYIEAFKSLGLDLVEIFINEIPADNLEQRAIAIGKIMDINSPMFVFSINFFPYISILCQSKRVFYISLSVTCPMVDIYNTTIRNSFNKVFLFDYEQYLSIVDENPTCIYYMPLGSAVSRFDALLGNRDNVDYRYDISFVGSLYNEKDPFIDFSDSLDDKKRYEEIMFEQIDDSCCGQQLLENRISDEDVKIIKKFAFNFYPSTMSVFDLDRFVAINGYLSPHMTFLERVKLLNAIAKRCDGKIHLFTQSDTALLDGVICHSGVDTIKEMPFVFRNSKINLNFTTRSIKSGIPQRIWDVLGCKGFLLTNYQEEIPNYLRIGKDLDAYENEKELIEKIDYYLKNDDVRNDIASSGYEEVKTKHTTEMRVIEMLRQITETTK